MGEIDEKLDDLLQQSGVKGMHWGHRKDTRATRKRYNSYNKGMKISDHRKLKKMTSSEARQKHLDERDKKWLDKVKDDKKIQKVSKRAAKEMKRVNKDLKKEFGGKGLKGNTKRALNGQLNAAYHKSMKEAYQEVIADHTHAVYKLSPSRTREVEIKALNDGTLKAVVVERHNPKLANQRSKIQKSVNNILKREAKLAAKQDSLTHADDTEGVSNLDGMFFIIHLDADGFADDVIPPFDDVQHSDDDETLEHHGTKGMHWGVRHDNHKLGTSAEEHKVLKTKDKGTIAKHLDSLKRERDWRKVASHVNDMSTKEIGVVTKRIKLENTLKTLSKNKVATKKDKQDYLRRHEMDDKEMQRKINRLNAKKDLHEAISNASKEQREIGLKVVQTVGSLGVKAALNGGKLQPKDYLDAVQNPHIKSKQSAWDESVKVADKYNRNEKVKKALKVAKDVKFKSKS